jgi:3-oxoisoapionate kinase
MTNPLPQDNPIFSFYGDDFTGSTDALEALAENGVDAVLFLRTPDADDLRGFGTCRAIGIAGDSRSRPPEWISRELPAVFGRLREIGAPVVQYKVCSTFDSSPHTGSIGRALEIGREAFGGSYVPVVPAAPLLRRYVVFGNLFAADGGDIHRIDRHPSMKHHPVTPMDESDLRLHLSRQTSFQPALVNLAALRAGCFENPDAAGVLLFDGFDEPDMARAAQWIWENRTAPQAFVVGSSGFTYGILDYWRSQGWLPAPAAPPEPAPTDRLLVLAGSCSPATARQIRAALGSGFHGIRLDAADLAWPAAEADAVAQLAAGRSVVVYSALGPSDRVEIAGSRELAASMGKLLRAVILASGVTRVVVAGGDTASHAVRELDITALTYRAPLARGAPLCRAHGRRGNLELVLKGGQVGPEDFFQKVKSWA